jgi:conjugative relaxase-like TrwC/TraI family protein
MLSMAKLSPGQERYYERSVAAGLDDYYAGRGESPGVWTGRGAAELGIVGVVGEGELGRLVGGCDPRSSAVLRRHPPRRVIRVERIDPATGERRLEEKVLSPVAGYDLVFSPPKSVSLLHTLGGEEARHAVTQAHLASWQAALAYLEAEACVVRKGRDGVIRESGSGFVAAAYQHRTSRSQDPHLHTHVIVANMTKTPSDGRWRALDGEALLRTHRLAAGYLYQAHLRHELTRSLGVEWRKPVQGMAEIAGIPEEVLRAFSTRRDQVVDYLERRGTSGFYAARVAALETRDRKEAVDLPRLEQEWRARAADHGLDQRRLAAVLGRGVHRDVDDRGYRVVAARLLGEDGLTEKRTTFTGPDVVMAWAEAHTQGAPVERILQYVRRFTALAGVVPLEPAAVPGRPATYSTRELVGHERAALRLVDRGRHAAAPTVSAASVEAVARGRANTLGKEQLAMVVTVASSRERVVCVVGRAGSGKTTALAAVAEAFRRDGVVVIGAAPSGVAARTLSEDTAILSGTLHRVLAEATHRGGLPPRCVLVVDEAGMADTRTLTGLLGHVEQCDGKAILVGDPAQLGAVGAGGLFAAIVERVGAVGLSDNHRQRDQLERRALAALRDGDSSAYLTHAAEQGRLVVADDAMAAKACLVADWWRSARNDLAGSVMIARRRRDVDDLNAAARALMTAADRLGRRLPLPSGGELAVGDRVICTRNDHHVGVVNGTRGTITDVDPAEGTATLEPEGGRGQVALPPSYLNAGHVSHAYALTGHKTQGVTVEHAFVLATGQGRVKEWGYVALSRARIETRVYTTQAQLEPDTPHAHQPDRPDPVDRLAEALTRPAAHTLAVDTQGVAQSGHRGAAAVRALVAQRETLAAERGRAQRDEQAIRRELAGMGILARARHGPRLRDQIVDHQHTLTHLNADLRRIDRQLHTLRQPSARGVRAAVSRRRRALERDASRQRGLGIEL